MKLHWLTSLTLFVASASALTTNISPDRRSTPDVDKELVERQATACRAGLILYAGRCIYPTRCPSGAFGNHQTQRCQTCISKFPNAATCSFTSATSCKVPFFLRLGRCVDVCPDNTFVLPGTRTCLGCTARFSFSLTCTSDEALSCREPRVLSGGQCVTAATCPDGQFRNTATNTCQPCTDTNALTCSSATVSLTCKTSFGLSNGVCVATTCGSGQYLSGSTCLTCPGSNVATCNSQTTLTCVTGFSLISGSCVATASCSRGQYRDSFRNICVSCAELGPGIATCTQAAGATECAPGIALSNGRCDCLTGQALDISTNPDTCISCTGKFGLATLACTASTATTCQTRYTVVATKCECAAPLYADTSVTPVAACRDCSIYGLYVTECSSDAPTKCSGNLIADPISKTCGCAAGNYIQPGTGGAAPSCQPCNTATKFPNSATCVEAHVLTCLDTFYYITPAGKMEPSCTAGETYSATRTVNFGDNYGGNAPSPGFQVTYVQPFLGPSVSEATCISSNIGMAAFEYESAPNGDINPAGSFCYTLESSLGVAVGSEIAVTPQPFQLITLTDEQTLNGERFWRMYLKNLACTSDDYRTLVTEAAVRYEPTNPPGTDASDEYLANLADICTDVILTVDGQCFTPPAPPTTPPATTEPTPLLKCSTHSAT